MRDTFAAAKLISQDGLRVLLVVEAEALKGWQWERLCAPIGVNNAWEPLRLEQATPFSFHIKSSSPKRYPDLNKEHLRVLVVVANPPMGNPYQLAHFDEKGSVAAIKRALGGIPHTILANEGEREGPPTLDMLMAHLTANRYTLVHIVAHGSYSERSGETYLYLLDGTGKEVKPVKTTELVQRWRTLPAAHSPQFAFLCTCESADPRAETALGGLGQRLVREVGTPAVVAMTQKVTIDTAQALTSPFYERLVAHGQVDLALVQACNTVFNEDDVLVPALYSRLEDGQLIKMGDEMAVAVASTRGERQSSSERKPVAEPEPEEEVEIVVPDEVDTRELFGEMARVFLDNDELKELCFSLGVNFADLGTENRRAAIRELIMRMQYDDRLPDLYYEAKSMKPNMKY
ncbi:MAG TPA: CHAT domain-containing protein [Anaerolineae bacterium]|nr:CHAT domain-containing protein [Anaerolineae bacterium]